MSKIKQVVFAVSVTFSFLLVKAQEKPQSGLWKGFEKIAVSIDGHNAYYVKPAHALPGNPWVWRASFPDWHTDMDSILLTRGFYIAYINVDNQYGSPQSLQVWDKFYNYLITKMSFAPKVALEAVSRGGLYAYGWAKRNPDKVSCVYAETPVCDIKSWPGGKEKGLGDAALWSQMKAVYHFTEAQAMAYNDNPVDNLEGLASFRVPVLHVIGLNDKLAPPAENTYLFAQRYITAGGPVSIYPVTIGPQELQGHHFPIDRPAYYADFIINNSFPVKKVLPYGDYYEKAGALPNFYKAVTTRKQATVTFLGGSITYNPGWRQKVCRYLEERFPDVKFHFIAAGIPSLGSLPHAFRLQRDVLDSGKTDLMFVEAAVNDRANGTDSTTQARALEGIIRHAKKSNPQMDIVMMAFADPDKTNDYNNNVKPAEIKNHELLAHYYNLPFINLAKEVRDKMNNKEFTWADDFKDLHPAVFGQELYFATIKSLLQDCFDHQDIDVTGLKTSLPKPLDKASFQNGEYYNIKNAVYKNGWTITDRWQPSDGLPTREGFVNIPVLSSGTPGAELSLPFRGTAIGIAIVSGSDAGIISFAIDNREFKSIDLYTQWSGMLHLPWYLLLGSDLKKGNHTLKVRISAQKNTASKGNACRIVNFLVNE
ncbi:GDSL-type esterase/lipase family protein [Mucilaginibacter gotjawali]|uniref:Sialidase-1 n=2 Tax=Mucilaginibacter gotjawali TaxID=1550579 RepID=A0A839S7G8_9SPHI|nr:GDSL-type esterase/lipase family protein [Mucilaginibacter gotjawali]MBB3053835.1 sialidase-1 [Mucilaginibacter gotjawali]BAU54098.1 Alpha/beta hydrolase family protein [Mucilaginibacter gotjawali]